MTRSFANPGTRVLGASPKIGKGGYQEKDNKGRLLWNMPRPFSFTEHKVRVRDPKTGRMVGGINMIPIYRAISAKLANYARSQARRDVRKAQEKQDDKNVE